jgi:hypothetical protein
MAGMTGCSNKIAKDVAAMNGSNLQRLANMYAAHQNYKGGQGPKSEAEFKAFIKDFDQEKLRMMGIDPTNVDAVFTSERDGKPFKVRYKVGGGRGSVDAVVFEQEGQYGKKRVGFTGGKVEEMDNAAYQAAWTGKGSHQTAGGPPSGGAGRGGRPAGAPTSAPTGPAG